MSFYRTYIDTIEDAKRALIRISEIMEKKEDFGIQKIFIREIRAILKGKITRMQLMRDEDELGVLSDQAIKTHRERYDKKPRAVCKRCYRKIEPNEALYVDKQGDVYCSEYCLNKRVKGRRITPDDADYNKFVKQSIMDIPRG